MAEAGTAEPQICLKLSFNKENNSIVLEIEDNGPGIEESVQKRIFEPFYTTKPVGKGTGLGLSVSYFIIAEGHGGEIEVFSSPDGGTKFVISLPVKSKYLPLVQ